MNSHNTRNNLLIRNESFILQYVHWDSDRHRHRDRDRIHRRQIIITPGTIPSGAFIVEVTKTTHVSTML